jgi:hypothetical protein
MKRKSNEKIHAALNQKIPDFLVKAGWFEQSKYNNGMPIGGIAAVQNYGAIIHQAVTEKQRVLLHYLGFHLKKTTSDITIVIPPTHFMENCQTENKEKWRKAIQDLWKMVFLGNLSPDKAMEQMGMLLEGDIARQITDGDYPPDKPSTVQNKLNRYKNKKTSGNLDKRLVDTGTMLNALSHQVEKI